MHRLFLVAAGCLLLAGCQTAQPLYYWGNYEKIAYVSYAKPDKATLEFQAEKLEEDLEKTAAGKSHAHPGLHAQLGYVYFQMGRTDDAISQFEIEKTLFPESVIFMDRMIEKIKTPPTP